VNHRIATALLVLVPSIACAAPTPEPEPQRKERELGAIQVTATRRPESTLDVPIATTVVTQAEIRARGGQTVMDALHGETGTFVQQTTPGQGVVIVRGLKGSEVLQLVDGFRLNNAIFRNAPNQYVALVDAQMLGRIEVVRGPMSTLYGSDAMGGVVHLISEEPSVEGSDWTGGGSVRFQYGSADDSTLSRAEGHAGHEQLVFSGGVTYQDVNDLRVGGGDELPYTNYTARGGNARVRAQVADGHELSFQLQSMEQPRTPRYDELVPGFGQATPTSSTFYFEPQIRDFAQLRWRTSNPNALWDSAEAQAGRQEIRDDRRSRDFGGANEDRERNTDTTDGFVFQAGKAIGDSHYLGWGGEYYEDEVDSSRIRRNIDTGATSVRAPRFPDGSTQSQWGLFLTDDWRFGGRHDLNVGVRYSHFEAALPASGAVAGVDTDADDVTGNISYAFALTDTVRLVSNLGRGFRAPNVFDLGTFGSRPGNRFNIPNPELEPETVASIDLGIKVGDERLAGELFVFDARYQDKITSVLTGAVTEAGQLVVQSQNATELDLWGVEAGARGYWRDDMSWYATATWTRGDETFDGAEDPADRVPPLFGKMGAVWDWRDDWAFEGYVLYATRQDRLSPRDLIDPRINPDGTAGWVSWNARAAWQATEDLELALRIENIGDKRYREHGTGLDEPGFNAIVSAELRF
jgi:TonB-dependent heme/hemoglobin receptor